MNQRSRKGIKQSISALAASLLVGALSSAAMAQTSTAVTKFDQGFLAEHPEVAAKLTADPNLINNPNFISNHPELKAYLKKHPGVRSQFKQNPAGFMGSANPNPGSGGFGNGGFGNGGGPGGEFFGGRGGVAEDIRENPSLLSNPQFLAAHPEVQEYLAAHPNAAQNLQNRGQRGMGWQSERNEEPNEQRGNRGGYLASHPEVAEDLRENPNLANDPQFRASHPGFQQFMRNHPGAENRWRARQNGGRWGQGRSRWSR